MKLFVKLESDIWIHEWYLNQQKDAFIIKSNLFCSVLLASPDPVLF